MKAVAKARTIGGSLVVTIPVEVVREESIRNGDLVVVDVEKRKKDFFGALKGVGPFTQADEMKAHE